jgi:hypothetical protein
MSVQIVIARYEESIDWIKDLSVDYVIYNKGSKIPESEIDPNKVIDVPNQGREAETYLRYIIDNYNKIPDFVIFLQGNPFDHCPAILHNIENIDFSQEFFSLGNVTSCDLMGNYSYPGLQMGFYRNEFIPNFSDSPIIDFVAGAQFIVKGDLIKNKTLSWWIQTMDQYNKYWFSDIESGYSKPPGHFIAHVFERLWPSIFKYIQDGK